MITTRREFLTCSSLASLGLLGEIIPVVHGAQARLPNVVMIVGDDQGWPDFGFMGHKVIQTPRLDQLAKESAVFPLGYVPTSLCRASLATLLTGQYPHQHHICCNDPPKGVDRTEMHPFIKKAPALPRLLREAGYVSLQTGNSGRGISRMPVSRTARPPTATVTSPRRRHRSAGTPCSRSPTSSTSTAARRSSCGTRR